jgi:alanine racemase
MFIEEVIRDTRAVVDLDCVREAMSGIRGLVGEDVEIMAIVKADGYGHGAVKVANAAIKSGAGSLGVAYPQEGAELRENNIDIPILVLGLTPPDDSGAIETVIKHGLTQTISDTELPKALNAKSKKVPVHVKVDTGMGRIGIKPDDVLEFLSFLDGLKNIKVEGIYTHFPSADEADTQFTKRQIDIFLDLIKQLKSSGISIPKTHMANSGGILAHPNSHLTTVRAGIILYGLYPSKEVEKTIKLTPAMSLVTRIRFIKKIPKGTSISYGRTFITKAEMTVATLPVGYADGYSRILSNVGHVLVRGRPAPILGRVCMDMTIVDVTNIPDAGVGDEVVLFGRQYQNQSEISQSEISTEQMADWLNTINYEVTCIVGKRVPRVYLNE